MALQPYRRKPAGRRKAEVVQAIQVNRPLRPVTYAFPRTRQRTKPSGVLDYIRLIDAPEGQNRARLGDWIVKFNDGNVIAVPKEEFDASYEPYTEEAEVGTQDRPGDTLD